jgi:hypothetical protein
MDSAQSGHHREQDSSKTHFGWSRADFDGSVRKSLFSPFARRYYVSHIPMDHTAVIKFVETRFTGGGCI